MWKQQGFVVISDVNNGDVSAPIIHAFTTAEREAKAKMDEVLLWPEPLREGLRIVPAILRFED